MEQVAGVVGEVRVEGFSASERIPGTPVASGQGEVLWVTFDTVELMIGNVDLDLKYEDAKEGNYRHCK